MKKHAAEMDSVVGSIRVHVAAMKATPAEWPRRVVEHVQRVGGLLAMTQRHMMEMGMHSPGSRHGQGNHDPGHGTMGDADHAATMTAAAQLRGELEILQTASNTELSARMGAHLQRVEEFIALIARSHAQHHHH